MAAESDDQKVREFLSGIRIGDVCGGTVAEVPDRGGVTITLDGFPARPVGTVRPSDVSWSGTRSAAVGVGERVTGEVIAVDPDAGLVRLAMTATEHPELWAFLKARRPGEVLSGTVAAIERFGVFVALDEGPGHPVLPGVGFITVPELSWRRLDSATDVVEVGQRVSCEFLQFDDGHGEAGLSLRALRPDPFRAFAESHSVGQRLPGRVTRLTPIGVFVRVADGIEGLVRPEDLDATPSAPARSAVGDDMAVVITNIDHDRRTLTLTQPRVVTGSE